MDNEPIRTQVYMRPRDALHRLSEAGVVHGLDGAVLDQLRKECWDDDEDQLEETGVLGILTMFYESIERGRADGFYWRDDEFWNQTDDVVAELSAVLGIDPPLFTQESITEKLSPNSASRRKEVVHILEARRDDGQELTIEARSLDDVVAAFNVELKARGRTLRIVPLDTSGEWRMYVAMELPQARQLAREGALPVEDMEGLVD
jgi:hypothetical protein